jgi:hypothetical protein
MFIAFFSYNDYTVCHVCGRTQRPCLNMIELGMLKKNLHFGLVHIFSQCLFSPINCNDLSQKPEGRAILCVPLP